jgi:guanylate kinase
LERRLRARGSEEEDVLTVRLDNARIEIGQADMYEYFIVNDVLDDAVDSLCSIIKALRCKMRRNLAGNSVKIT